MTTETTTAYPKSLAMAALALVAGSSVYFYFIDSATRLFGDVVAPLIPYGISWLCLFLVVSRYGAGNQLSPMRVLRLLIMPLVLAAGVVFAGYLTTWIVGSALYRGHP